ncbi:MAG TPA: DUF4097 family beta strand repeat-containing protein [Terriglobales bacterium]|nr:DUF4097 family beta strand repeat-containing protein [Terriglobales bacterium]
MQSLRSRISIVFSVILMGSALCAASTPRGTFEKSYPVTGAVDLKIFTHSGDVAVRKGPAGTVSVKGKIFVNDRWRKDDWQQDVHAIEQNPPIHQSGNNLQIDYVEVKNIAIDYEITVPADTTLTTKSGSGDLVVEGVEHPVDLITGSGDVKLRDIKADVKLHTGSGDVIADQIAGRFDFEAGSGDIRIAGLSGSDARLRTGSGDIEIRDLNAPLSVETGSGNLTAEGTMAGAWELRTGSGDVRLRLAGQPNFELDASTSSGEVVVDHPVTMTVQGNLEHARKNVRGTVGTGGPRLTVHTGSGDVHIQ